MIWSIVWVTVLVAAFVLAYLPLPGWVAWLIPFGSIVLVIVLVEHQPPNAGGDSNKPIVAWVGAIAVATVIAAAAAGAWGGRPRE